MISIIVLILICIAIVALSRCKTIENTWFNAPITEKQMKISYAVKDYA